MDNMGDWEQNRLTRELTQGRELARRLQLHLNVPSSSHETREMLVQGIVSSYEKALTMLNWSSSSVGGGADHQQPAAAQAFSAGVGIESPPLSGSPRSEESDHDQDHKDGSKKRKATPRWTHQVRVNPGTGLEGTLDDGFSWRKYGQKDILGAKYPRGYYRCTHRHVQDCLATKQVQRSDDDPTIFEISYRGKHTCSQATRANPSSFVVPPENQEANMALLDPQQHGSYQYQQQHPQEALSNLRRSLKVVTQDLEIQQEALPSFPHYFASTSNSASKPDQNQVFSPSLLMNSNNTFTGSGNYFSSPANFMSPATSATNYFAASPSGIINSLQGGGSSSNNQNFQSSDQPERNEIISATASATNSPTVGVDFPFGNAEFDENFTFDNSGIFSTFHPFQK